MTCGEEAILIEYINAFDVKIMFKKFKDIYTCTYQQFKNGQVKSKLFPSMYNMGFVGLGEYKVSENSIHTIQYIYWEGMMRRCFGKKLKEKHHTYDNCTCCTEWLNFQVFAEWFDNNYYEIDGDKINLDKDILVKGNKIYSSETCVFVPQNINKLFCKTDSNRGTSPIGVSWHKQHNKFSATCNNGYKKKIHLGYFDTEIEAFNIYKKYKEKVIKQMADLYKDKIPKKLYNAMYNWKVEIDD